MQINRCPKCGREPEFEKFFKFSEDLGGFYFAGWKYRCLNCGLNTGRCDTHEEAVAKWNELTEGKGK